MTSPITRARLLPLEDGCGKGASSFLHSRDTLMESDDVAASCINSIAASRVRDEEKGKNIHMKTCLTLAGRSPLAP